MASNVKHVLLISLLMFHVTLNFKFFILHVLKTF